MNLLKIGITILLLNIFALAYSQTTYTFNDGLSKAKSSGKLAVVAICQPNDSWCAKMESVYSTSSISNILNSSFIFIKLDASGGETYTYAGKQYKACELAKVLGATGYPTHTFLSSDGTILKFKNNGEMNSSYPGYVEAGNFEIILNYFSSGKYKDTDLSKLLK